MVCCAAPGAYNRAMLLGRSRERRRIDDALAQARAGASAALALTGDPGIGKTTLLDYAAAQAAASGMQVLRARGVESEAQIPFGSLLEVIRPALTLLDTIPPPQSAALEGALALRPGAASDRFAGGAATLSLLAACAEQAPAALLLDDAQWLDVSSAQALLFAIRRLVADRIAVLITVRAGEPSVLDGADLPVLELNGLTSEEALQLVPGLSPEAAARLHAATAGNPLGLLELAAASQDQDLELAPEGAPLLVTARISRAFLSQVTTFGAATRRALVLAAACDTGDLPPIERAAARLGIDLAALAPAESAGLIRLQHGSLEFRHPLARSAVYAAAAAGQRRAAHRALAAALPDRDIGGRAWHLAAAATGTDESASAALEQAGSSGLDRSAYAAAAAAFERAARLTASGDRRARLLRRSAEARWLAGFTDHAVALLAEARESTANPALLAETDELAGHIAARCGPVMRGHAILTAAAGQADPERAIGMLAEAALACLYAGNPAEMAATADRITRILPVLPSRRASFLASMTAGMAGIFGADAAAGAQAVRSAVTMAEESAQLRDDVQLIPWLALGPLFLRQASADRALLDHAVLMARLRAAAGALPLVLNLIGRDHAGTDRWAAAAATYQESIGLARESGQRTELTFGLAGLAWLEARRGREAQCRACAGEALGLSRELEMGLSEIWATAALGELELGLGDAARAAEHFEHQRQLLREHGITDADLNPGAELTEAYSRLGLPEQAGRAATEFISAAAAKGQPWPRARALRCQGLISAGDASPAAFEEALDLHAQTPDAFETARTQLAYGERLRRIRNRTLAREQLRSAAETFEILDARPWADRAFAELAATGQTLRRRDHTAVEELTPQELQISLLLTAGRTTREAASALFLSPKTVEYHLRHVYQKLGIHSRDELAHALAAQSH